MWWPAAKVNQIGALRRNTSRASGEGSSWPSARMVAAGARRALAPSMRSKAIMLRVVKRRGGGGTGGEEGGGGGYCGVGKGEGAPGSPGGQPNKKKKNAREKETGGGEQKHPAVSKTATKTRPAARTRTAAPRTTRKQPTR